MFDANVYAVKSVFETRLEEWEGPIDSPLTAQKMQEEKRWLDEQYAEFAEQQRQYEKGELSWEEMEAAKVLMQPADSRMAAYSEVEARIQQMEAIGEAQGQTMWLLNYRWFLRLFNNQDPDILQNQRTSGLMAILLCILLIAPLYAWEEQTGVRAVVRGSGRGRGRMIWRKQLYVFLMTVVTFVLVFGAYFWSVVRIHGIHGWDAPMQSIIWLSNSPWKLTVGQFTILLYALRFVSLWAVAELVLAISSILKKVQCNAGGNFPDPAAVCTVDGWRFGSGISERGEITQHDGNSGCGVVYRMELFPSVYCGSAAWNRMRYLE